MGGGGLRGGNGSVFASVEGSTGHRLHDGQGGWPHMGYEFTPDGKFTHCRRDTIICCISFNHWW